MQQVKWTNLKFVRQSSGAVTQWMGASATRRRRLVRDPPNTVVPRLITLHHTALMLAERVGQEQCNHSRRLNGKEAC